jgi:hypothetical protein
MGRTRMAPIRGWRCAAIAAALSLIVAHNAHAGGVGFTDEDNTGHEGLRIFGFVRDVDGPGIADAKVTAEVKGRGAVVVHTDILGIFKIPGLGKDINPDDVVISCAKDGYKQARVERRPHPAGSTDPIEVECYLQKQ